MKYIILILFLLIISCQSSKDNDNKYFYNFNHELSVPKLGLNQIQALYNRELKKYKQTGNRKFLISSKFAQMLMHRSPDDRIEQIPLVYELLKLNNDQYDYITIACKVNLAPQLETTSPDLSMQVINEAILLEEKIGKNYYLSHLYGAKAGAYYNKGNYKDALFYFDKALKTLDPSNLLFIASEHNNFGMCYEKMNKMNLALQEVSTAINILEHKFNPNDEERSFIHHLKENKAEYLLKVKDYKNAEELLVQELSFYKTKSNYLKIVKASKGLYEVYTATNENNKRKELVDYVKSIEPDLKDLSVKIDANQIIEDYFLSTNDLINFKIVFKKLKDLNNQYDKQSDTYLKKVSNQLNLYTIKSINQKYDHKIAYQTKKIWVLLLFISFSILIFGLVIILIRNKNKRKRELSEKEKLILEQDVKIKKNKIENLHINLNLRVEAEKVFLENLKKVKKNKNINPEEMLHDLVFKVNNLIQMTNKNNDLTNESSLENKIFIDKLSTTFPFLTEQEKKLCTYFKLGLSSKEVSLLENITDGSARVYKARIKSKMKLDKDTALHLFLNTL